MYYFEGDVTVAVKCETSDEGRFIYKLTVDSPDGKVIFSKLSPVEMSDILNKIKNTF